MATKIVSGYVFDPNDLERFIHKLLGDDDPWLAENNDTSTHYTTLLQWMRTIPKEERVASVQFLWTKSSDMLACIITGIAEHPSCRARIVEDEKQQNTRDRFLEKANTAVGVPVFAAERTRYFNCRQICLGGYVGDRYFSYDWVPTEEKRNEEAASSSPAQTALAKPTTSASIA
ncbi:hypothetical protein DENSPDRAFT_843851 [Dentipellis sp. KUC8613]|nr:hypothetical protein DENSPDRAFT_843851 [Dentipellis sp. KUC8613]